MLLLFLWTKFKHHYYSRVRAYLVILYIRRNELNSRNDVPNHCCLLKGEGTTGKTSEFQEGIEPTTSVTLVGWSNHWTTRTCGGVLVAEWLEHLTGITKVVGLIPTWHYEMFCCAFTHHQVTIITSLPWFWFKLTYWCHVRSAHRISKLISIKNWCKIIDILGYFHGIFQAFWLPNTDELDDANKRLLSN